jgi:hypothetical protein
VILILFLFSYCYVVVFYVICDLVCCFESNLWQADVYVLSDSLLLLLKRTVRAPDFGTNGLLHKKHIFSYLLICLPRVAERLQPHLLAHSLVVGEESSGRHGGGGGAAVRTHAGDQEAVRGVLRAADERDQQAQELRVDRHPQNRHSRISRSRLQCCLCCDSFAYILALRV